MHFSFDDAAHAQRHPRNRTGIRPGKSESYMRTIQCPSMKFHLALWPQSDHDPPWTLQIAINIIALFFTASPTRTEWDRETQFPTSSPSSSRLRQHERSGIGRRIFPQAEIATPRAPYPLDPSRRACHNTGTASPVPCSPQITRPTTDTSYLPTRRLQFTLLNPSAVGGVVPTVATVTRTTNGEQNSSGLASTTQNYQQFQVRLQRHHSTYSYNQSSPLCFRGYATTELFTPMERYGQITGDKHCTLMLRDKIRPTIHVIIN